jgi:Trk K+ transport system NAD-binding subunit
VVVCGLGGLGLRIVEELVRLAEQVVVLDPRGDPPHRATLVRLGVTLVQGDPSDPGTLRRCAIPGARAVVLTSDSDVANIHAALAAVALDPAIHVVMRAFDEEFGRRVEALIPGLVAMSSSAIAAPGFVSALLDERTDRRLDLLGRDIAVREIDPDDPSVLAVLADRPRGPVTVFPSPGTREAATKADPEPSLCLVDASGDPARTVQRAHARMPWIGAPRPSLIRRVDRRFWFLTVVIVALVALAAVVFEHFAGESPIEAIYQAIKGVIGGADASVQDTTELRFFALLLTVVGAIILAAFYGLIVDVIMSARVSTILGPHVGDARDHVIVVGFGSVGYRVAMALRERGVGVVAADPRPDPRFVEAARQRGIALLIGDARDPDLLRTLHVERARGLLAGTDDDAANLATALQARSVRPDLRIAVRLFDPDLASRLESTIGGFESRSVDALAAPSFAAAAVGRQVLATLPVGARILVVARVPVEEGSVADGSSVAREEDAAGSVARGGCRVVAVIDGDEVRWRPDGSARLTAGREMLVVATRRGLATSLQRATAPSRQARPRRRSERIAAAATGLWSRIRDLVARAIGRRDRSGVSSGDRSGA